MNAAFDEAALLRAENEELGRRLARMERQLEQPQLSHAEQAAAQAAAQRIDEAARWVCRRSPLPAPGEGARAYVIRALKPLQQYSERWANRDLNAAAGRTLDIAEAEIRRDTLKAAEDPKVTAGKTLVVREQTERGETTRYFGDTRWMEAFKAAGATVIINREVQ